MADTYGVVQHKGATYMYKGVRFRRGQPAEVDLATRHHLIGTGHFKDVDFQEPTAEPIPVKRQRGSVAIKGRRAPEPGMVSAEGGATATNPGSGPEDGDEGDDFEGAEQV